jgi:hypothetical protein
MSAGAAFRNSDSEGLILPKKSERGDAVAAKESRSPTAYSALGLAVGQPHAAIEDQDCSDLDVETEEHESVGCDASADGRPLSELQRLRASLKRKLEATHWESGQYNQKQGEFQIELMDEFKAWDKLKNPSGSGRSERLRVASRRGNINRFAAEVQKASLSRAADGRRAVVSYIFGDYKGVRGC